jgi:hypothetical protein
MQTIWKILAVAALALTVVPPILFATKSLGEAAMKGAMVAGCVLWFVASPFAMKGGSQ